MIFLKKSCNFLLLFISGFYKKLFFTGCGSVWLERSVRDAEAEGFESFHPDQ